MTGRGLVLTIFFWLSGMAAAAAGPPAVAPIDGARGLYLLRCGGCHGIQGVSVPSSIPTLRGRAGVFLCSAQGKDYVLRLPNIQMALIRDDQALADVLNFVAFDLGGGSAPRNAARFTAQDVARVRLSPMPPASLLAGRDSLLRDAGACAAAYNGQDIRVSAPY